MTLLSLFFVTILLPANENSTPVLEIRLDNKGQFLSRGRPNDVVLERDGTILGFTKYHLWHWNQDGSLIRKIGGKGEGPGEFLGVSQALWTGEYYWVIDGNTLTSSIFDKQGRFLYKQNLYFRQFVRTHNRLFKVDFSKFDYHRKSYPPTLYEINYAIDDEKLEANPTDLFFKKITERQMNLGNNMKLAWMVEEQGRFLVVDQLEPKIRVYDAANIATEKNANLYKPFEGMAIPIQARKWVEPPPSFKTRHKDRRSFVSWWQSWSRVTYFGKLGNHLVIAYEIPDPKDSQEALQVLQPIDRQGKAIGDHYIVPGLCIGSQEDQLFVFVEGNDPDLFEYFIRIYKF